MVRRSRRSKSLLLMGLICAVPGCSDSEDSPDSDDDGSQANGSPPTSGSGGSSEPETNDSIDPNAVSSSSEGTPCSVDTECTPLACHPVSSTCEQVSGSCSLDADCGEGFFCNAATGLCLAGKSGSPCTTDANCYGGGVCSSGACGCAGFVQEQELVEGRLDIYYVFDHSTSMTADGTGFPDPARDCAYAPGSAPPIDSKACLATYAFADYLLTQPAVDSRLALQFMSLAGQPGQDTCQGDVYGSPLIDMTPLPLTAQHAMISAISDDAFDTSGTQIEGALRGIAQYTAANKVPEREMIGVLMTDGDPTECDLSIDNLADVVAEHYATTGIRTFIIGMDGATEASLEQLAIEGGAEPHDDFCGSLAPPCHYWNVGDGSGEVLAQALDAIIDQSAPLGCEFPLADIMPAAGQTLDTSTINVTLTGADGVGQTIFNVPSAADCPASELAWHYDDAANPSQILLCPGTCDVVGSTGSGAAINIVGGCESTMVIPR